MNSGSFIINVEGVFLWDDLDHDLQSTILEPRSCGSSGFFTIFTRKATDFHRKVNLFELNL